MAQEKVAPEKVAPDKMAPEKMAQTAGDPSMSGTAL
jgi:hypothetical protein